MADGHHFHKSKIAISAHGMTDRHKILHDGAYWLSEPYPEFKSWLLKNATWHTATSLNKSSAAVAEMGNHLATIGMGRKWRGAAVGGWVPI